MSFLEQINNLDESESENDADYVPSGGENESEDNSDVAVPSDEDAPAQSKKIKTKKKKKNLDTSRKRKGGIKLEDEEVLEEKQESDDEGEDATEKSKENPIEKKSEYNKERANSLWQDFLKDVGESHKTKNASSTVSPNEDNTKEEKLTDNSKSSPTKNSEPPKKITLVEEYDFAGETVKVTKEVEIDSQDPPRKNVNHALNGKQTSPSTPSPIASVKRKSGLANLVGNLSGKKPKMSTLTKSQLDWQKFKEEQGISEDLERFNKGKEGYLQKQAFLSQVDMKQFEIEKKIREKIRSTKPSF